MAASLAGLLVRRGTPEASPPATEISDELLMHRVQTGDSRAFETIFARYRDPLWRFFRRRVADTSSAEELTQQTFLAALSGASRYEARGAFRSYLFGIAFNTLMEWRRHSRRYEEVDAESPAPSGDPDAGIWVRTALAGLEPEQREILMLREYEQLSYLEIAEVLALPLNTVRSRLFRAREAMRVALTARVSGEVNHGDR